MIRSIKLKLDFVIWGCLQLTALATTLLALTVTMPDEKKAVLFLPLGYMVVNLVFSFNFNQFYHNIAKLLIFIMTFIRLVVLPGLYLFCINQQLFAGHAVVASGFGTAVSLMLYEYAAIHLVIAFHDYLFPRRKSNYVKQSEDNSNLGSILLVIIACMLLIAAVIPERLSTYKTIFTLNEADFTKAHHLEFAVGGLKRVLSTLFNFFLSIVRIMGPVYLLQWVHRKKRDSMLATWILVLCCVGQFFCLTDTFAHALVACLTISLAYLYLYPSHFKRVMFSFSLFCVGMGIVYFGVRFVIVPGSMYNTATDTIYHFAGKINAYFTGVDNVAAMFNVPNGHQWEVIKAGVLGAIPFNSTLFGEIGRKLQYFFNFYNVTIHGQIPPTLGSGYYQGGLFLAPSITMLFVYLSLLYNDWAKKAPNVFKQAPLQFCSISFALGTVMYGVSITLSLFFSWGIPMICIAALGTRGQQKKYE